ncbi:hypothetical protein LOZ59_006869 [Ophidiomyces ophidiicola]|nr:hypothetical protein LOZ59_006869 [Ophidiomyces ophidiicola]KAI2078723.1 hypothetical protein LOZ36_006809 [Ophidiomyces ophidiicola]
MFLSFRPRAGCLFCKWNRATPSQSNRGLAQFHNGDRRRLSAFWVPTGGIAQKGEDEDGNELLLRAGFLRQAYSGIFHLLPLGLRVQQKLELLIDKHMQSLGASKLSLSSVSSQALWVKSGRLNADSEVFRFEDRKGTPLLLAPTHEEEMTTLVGTLVKSYKDLPLRVYQICEFSIQAAYCVLNLTFFTEPAARKYRDEPRPRQGLLRGREFLMKDLYTFDCSVVDAMRTYHLVKEAYMQFFAELKLPYMVAAADSGNMGGGVSHEFHFPSLHGEDTLISCTNCNHVFNEELADGRFAEHLTEQRTGCFGLQEPDYIPGAFGPQEAFAISTGVWNCISKDENTLIRAYYPKFLTDANAVDASERVVNPHAIRSIAMRVGIDIDLSVKNPFQVWKCLVKQAKTKQPNVLDVYDYRVQPFNSPPPLDERFDSKSPTELQVTFSCLSKDQGTESCLDLISIQPGDRCHKCEQHTLQTHAAVELGHTFYLGTRYSVPLNATIATRPSNSNATMKTVVPLEMGCYGIGISRMISAVAFALADSKGLNWPQVIAPFSVCIIFAIGLQNDAELVYDTIISTHSESIDPIIDDRQKDFAWKMRDADLIGFPVILILGRAWVLERKVEVQCRRLNNLCMNICLKDLSSFVSMLLKKL